MGWFRWQQAAANAQARIVTQLRSQGAVVVYDYEFDAHDPIYSVDREPYSLGSDPYIPGQPPFPDLLIRWFGKDFFCGVAHIDMPDHDDALIGSVLELHDLQSIGVGNVDPELIAGLCTLNRLHRIQFWDTVTPKHVSYAASSPAKVIIFEGNICDPQLFELSQSKTVRHVDGDTEILGNSFTDRGVESVSKMHQLESLTLTSEMVTSKGLAFLERLPNLRSLKLRLPNASESVGRAIQGKPLKHLEILGMDIHDDACEAIQNSDSLEYLHVDVKRKGDSTTTRLVQTVTKLKNLRTIVIESGELTLAEIQSLVSKPTVTVVGCETSASSASLDSLSSQYPSTVIYRLKNSLTMESFGWDQARAIAFETLK